ncbi:DNA-directed RNA polymerase core subunit rpc10 [Sticta canariensis]|nr:DNA-directed RNA polymerase core subunit rpc10 [Sticta canariensis]
MSRKEAYAPPTLPTGGSAFGPSSSGDAASGPITQYLCGDCNSKVQLKKGDPIRCKECGHRVLYKERTKRMVQFEAR